MITQRLLTPFQVPDDGPAGHLLKMMDRHPFRPAHIHLVVRHEAYKHLTTQIFDEDCRYLADDSVFAVKDELSVTFAPREGDPEAKLELQYDITLAPRS
jgi:catechol 1,2-dioxygenase